MSPSERLIRDPHYLFEVNGWTDLETTKARVLVCAAACVYIMVDLHNGRVCLD